MPAKLKASDASSLEIKKENYLDNEHKFRFDLNEDAMATEKLSSGISTFAAAAVQLKDILAQKI